MYYMGKNKKIKKVKKTPGESKKLSPFLPDYLGFIFKLFLLAVLQTYPILELPILHPSKLYKYTKARE